MEKIIVNVAWCDKNFGGSLGSNVPGAVVFTAPTFEALQKEAKDSLEFHVEGLLENGEDVPEWLKNGDYEFVYNYQDATTLLKAYSPYVSLAAISRASGINQSLLSHIHGQYNYGIMGLSFRPGDACVVSTFRLKRKDDLWKVTIHEFLHSRGLPHCKKDDLKCLMQDAHGKNTFYMKNGLCQDCQKSLKNIIYNQ